MIKQKKPYRLPVILSIIFLMITGCSNSKTSHVHKETNNNKQTTCIMDCAGREVLVPVTINRIVDLQLDGTKTLIQLGMGDKVVGVTARALESFSASRSKEQRFSWTMASKVGKELSSLPNIGTYKELNIEKIISLKPDIIFAPMSFKQKADMLQEQMNIPIVCMGNYATLDYKMLKLVGKIMGKEERADALITYSEAIIKGIGDKISHIREDEKVKVFIVTPPSDFKGQVYKTMAKYKPIELAGGINLASRSELKGGSIEISKEQITAWNPDIILIYSTCMHNNDMEIIMDTIREDAILKTTNAVKNNRIHTYVGWDYGWDAAVGVAQMPYMAKVLYPDIFEEVDAEQEGNAILEQFYGIEGLFTEMKDEHNLLD